MRNKKKKKSNEEEEKNEKSQWENKRKIKREIKGTCRLDRLILYTAITYRTELTNLGGFIVIVSSTIRCDINFKIGRAHV